MEQICLFLSHWLGISKWAQGQGFNIAFAKILQGIRQGRWMWGLWKALSCIMRQPWRWWTLKIGIRQWILELYKLQSCLCSGAVLNSHKAVQCDKCTMWVHNECSYITETLYETVQNSTCTWICPKCDFFNFSDTFFDDQLNLKDQNRFDSLTNEKKTRSSSNGIDRNNFANRLKFVSMNINSIRGKKNNCWPSLIFTNLMLWPFKKHNLQLYCNFRIISGNLPIQCIQKRQESSRRWCNVTCSQGYPTHAHYRTGKQL